MPNDWVRNTGHGHVSRARITDTRVNVKVQSWESLENGENELYSEGEVAKQTKRHWSEGTKAFPRYGIFLRSKGFSEALDFSLDKGENVF